MIPAAIFIFTLYTVLLLVYLYGYLKLKSPDFVDPVSVLSFSLIIPFRNEHENLPNLLESIAQLDYDKNLFEILFVDDHSTDHSAELIDRFKKDHPQFNLQVIENMPKPGSSAKKSAIETAIKKGSFDWILTTDADCVLPKNWLKSFQAAIGEYDPVMLAAPVENAMAAPGFLHHFQNYEFLSLQAVTMGGFGIKMPFMCDGANLCYKKSAFYVVGGFDGNEEIAGGDDLFLLEKMQKTFPGKVGFNKSRQAIVLTKPSDKWKTLVQQRIRWASKTAAYKDPHGKITGLLVFLCNLMPVLIFSLSLFYPSYFLFLLQFVLFKMLADLLLVLPALRFFGQKFHLPYYLLSSLIYPFFHVYIGLRSFGGFTWKGRVLKK